MHSETIQIFLCPAEARFNFIPVVDLALLFPFSLHSLVLQSSA